MHVAQERGLALVDVRVDRARRSAPRAARSPPASAGSQAADSRARAGSRRLLPPVLAEVDEELAITPREALTFDPVRQQQAPLPGPRRQRRPTSSAPPPVSTIRAHSTGARLRSSSCAAAGGERVVTSADRQVEEGLNPRPPGPQPGALPTELPPPRQGQDSLGGGPRAATVSGARLGGLEEVGFDWPVTGTTAGVEASRRRGPWMPCRSICCPTCAGRGYGAGYELDRRRCLRAHAGRCDEYAPRARAPPPTLRWRSLLAVRRRLVEGDRPVREGEWACGWAGAS